MSLDFDNALFVTPRDDESGDLALGCKPQRMEFIELSREMAQVFKIPGIEIQAVTTSEQKCRLVLTHHPHSVQETLQKGLSGSGQKCQGTVVYTDHAGG